MRAQLLHLSGPRRGRTDTPGGEQVLLGCDREATIRFPQRSRVAPRHALLSFDDCGCDFLLRALDGEVFVNHRQVQEVILQPGDLIELGAGGPKARFRVWYGDGRTCKPVRTMLGDAAAVRRESGLVASSSTLVRDLLTQATRTLKVGFALLVLGLVGLAFGAGWVGGGKVTGNRLNQELEALRTELEQLRAGQQAQVSRAEVDAMRAELAARSAEIESLARARAIVRRVLERDSRGVCLIHGSWGLRVPDALRVPGGPEFLVDGKTGTRVEMRYTGSGFHVGGGQVVTNRHVALPWEDAEEIRRLVERGFQPSLFGLGVTFPGHPTLPADLAATRVRDADVIDVAVLTAAVPTDVPVLAIDDRPDTELRGETVLVVGYPTGVNALLARLDEDVARQVVDAAGGELEGIIAGLVARDAVTPVVTRGVLAEVHPTRLVYDAETTSGGSGGPVIGSSGDVLGVNFAITVGFGGSNFGVPIRFATELLR
ncbi:MAG: trypsin-like peptidase domain-containing protein [Planctomycetes bacterium]|nr:trypsin-like peptidase domain-containing protein [Planctomycetota bacterium]